MTPASSVAERVRTVDERFPNLDGIALGRSRGMSAGALANPSWRGVNPVVVHRARGRRSSEGRSRSRRRSFRHTRRDYELEGKSLANFIMLALPCAANGRDQKRFSFSEKRWSVVMQVSGQTRAF